MKKIALVLTTIFALSAVTAFADDALVLPTGVFRITTAFSYASAGSEFDADGESQDLDAALKAFNLGLALEYGINDWISAAVQWAPGYNVWSDIEDSDAKLNGAFDIFAGAKLQIVGPKAPVVNESIRFAVAPGIKIPLPGADFEEAYDNMAAGDDFIYQDPDKHALGLGGRLYADYVVNEMFFINAYSEFIYYLERKGVLTGPTPSAYASAMEVDIAYGYDLTLELEPHFEYMINEGMRLAGGLPFTYTMSPDKEVNGETVDDSASNLLKIGPSASLFFMKTTVPFEVKLGYSLPLTGTNENKFNTLTLQGKVYLKF
jgi:hypothetical protein